MSNTALKLAGALYLVFPTAPPTGYWELETAVILETLLPTKIKGNKMYKHAMYKKPEYINAQITRITHLILF